LRSADASSAACIPSASGSTAADGLRGAVGRKGEPDILVISEGGVGSGWSASEWACGGSTSPAVRGLGSWGVELGIQDKHDDGTVGRVRDTDDRA
jgi:hypothetical protein